MLQIFNFNNIPINFGEKIPQIGFAGKPVINFTSASREIDSFVTNPLNERFGTAQEIEAEAKSNPAIVSLLREHNIQKIEVNKKNLDELQKGHLKDTRMLAVRTYTNLPNDLKREVNFKDLQEAAMFHDLGKVLIPDEILNKKGKLTPDEWKVMQLHSELGYELAKNKGLSPRTLELIKYHHQTENGIGYPALDGCYYEGLDSQILRAADEYSALTEERSYKKALSREEALDSIKNDFYISKEVYDSLEKSV